MKKRLSLLLIATFTVATTYGQSSIDVLQAQYNNDITALLSYCNSRDKEIANEAYKALFAYTDLNSLSFPEIAKYYNIAKTNPTLEPLFGKLYEEFRQKFYASYKSQTISQVWTERSRYNDRQELIDDFFKDNFGNYLDELTFEDLTYLQHEVPTFMYREIQRERDSRTSEKQALAKKNAYQYCNLEKQHIDKLCYVFEKSILEYLYLNYGQVIVAYAKHELPNTVEAMDAQYKQYVKKEFSDTKFRSFMQGELNKFCAEINKVRSNYAKQCGKTNYVKLTLNMPKVNISSYSAPTDNLQKILTEKAEYEDSKSTVDGIATVAGAIATFFDGGLLSNLLITGAKHLITGGMASDMQENVLEARKSYISDVLQSMEQNIESQFSSVENSLKQQLSDNELKFRNDVEK